MLVVRAFILILATASLKVGADESKSPPPVQPMFTGISEIIIVVEDLEASMRRQWEEFGIGPWEVWTFDGNSSVKLRMRGENSTAAFRVAYTKIGDIYWELVQPLDQRSTYAEVLRTHGEGVHNIVFDVDDFDNTRRRMRALGIAEWNSGEWGDVDFINFDTRKSLSVVAEIFRVAPDGSFPPPELIYPPQLEASPPH